ncbi:MAG: DNA cytosine methyltransferase [Caulobacter sp.]|nr:DNA cytosine methyltransferase [Caulobacter sp.]
MSRNARLSFLEFFAGGGMARLGLGDGWTCGFANDFDPLKAGAYRANFADAASHFQLGDVWQVSPDSLPGPADLAWASSPCQDFSLAGGRAGLTGGRSGAFFGFWRLVQALAAEGRAPRTVVIENVVGLLTSHGGADFTALCAALAGEGYRFGALEIDASAFLPQSRPRVFVIATREPVPAALIGGEAFRSPAVRAARDRLPAELRQAWLDWRLAAPPARNTRLTDLLEPDASVVWRSEAQTAALLAQMSPLHRQRLDAAARSGRTVAAVFRRTRGGVPKSEIRLDGAAGCLRTPRGGSSRQMILVAEQGLARSRLLTGREGARLMGLPDDYQLPHTQTGSLHVIGDGVCVPVVRWLAGGLLEPLLLGVGRAAA